MPIVACQRCMALSSNNDDTVFLIIRCLQTNHGVKTEQTNPAIGHRLQVINYLTLSQLVWFLLKNKLRQYRLAYLLYRFGNRFFRETINKMNEENCEKD